jgi:hypothetical protein
MKEALGIGAVMAEVAYLSARGRAVTELELLKSLRFRHEITEEEALGALNMTTVCGAVERLSNGMVLLKSRPKNS